MVINQGDLVEKIGTLSQISFHKVLDGIRLIIEPVDII